MNRRLFLYLPFPFAALFGWKMASQDPPPPQPIFCPLCHDNQTELIDSNIYACRVVGCGVLFRLNKEEKL